MIKKFPLFLIVACSFFACKKKDNTYSESPKYTGSVMVNFNNYISADGYWGYAKKDIDLVNNWIDLEFDVKVSNTIEPATDPIKVKLIKTDVNVYDYNTRTGNFLTPVPVNALKFEQTEVTIARGARTASFKFQVNPSLLNLNNQYAVGISIAEILSGNATVNNDNNQSRLVVELGTLNPYDGIYRLSNFFFHPTNNTLGGIKNFTPVYMVTSGASSLDSYVNTGTLTATQVVLNIPTNAATFFSGVNPRFIINTTTSAVTLGKAVSTSVDFLQDASEAGLSKYYAAGIPGYSPGKKTIVAHFRWQSGGPGTDRVCKDTFVYVSPR